MILLEQNWDLHTRIPCWMCKTLTASPQRIDVVDVSHDEGQASQCCTVAVTTYGRCPTKSQNIDKSTQESIDFHLSYYILNNVRVRMY